MATIMEKVKTYRLPCPICGKAVTYTENDIVTNPVGWKHIECENCGTLVIHHEDNLVIKN